MLLESPSLVTQEYELLQRSCGLKKNRNLFCLETSRRGLNLENIIISSVIFPFLIVAFISEVSIVLLYSFPLFKNH